MNDTEYATLADNARALGEARGRAAGSWVIDGNTSDDTKRAILAGYESGDPEIMDMQPSPLSGEWAGDPLPADVLAELVVPEDSDAADDLLMAYEDGFSQGYWGEVIRSATATLADV